MHTIPKYSIHDLSEKELLILRQETENRKKSALVTWLLWLFLGVFGAHRFYLGKTGTGIAMLFTLGGVFIWYLIDIFLIPGMLKENEHNLQSKILQEMIAVRANRQLPISPSQQGYTLKCARCGSNIAQGMFSCTYCGAPLMSNPNQSYQNKPAFNCPYCGNQVMYGINPCPSCKQWLQW